MAQEIQELVVKVTPEGIDETVGGLERQQDAFEDTTGAMDDQSGALGDFSQRWEGATNVITEGLATTVGTIADAVPVVGSLASLLTLGFAGFLTQVPIVGEVLSGLISVVKSLALRLDELLRPVLEPVVDGLFMLSEAIASGDWQGVIDMITDFAQTMLTIDWGRVFGDIVRTIRQFLDRIDAAELLDHLIGGLSAFVSAGARHVGEFFEDVVGLLPEGFLSSIGRTVGDFFVRVIKALPGGELALEFGGILVDGMDRLVELAGEATTKVAAFLNSLTYESLIAAIGSSLIALSGALTDWIQGLVRAVNWGQVFNTLKAELVDTFADALESAVTTSRNRVGTGDDDDGDGGGVAPGVRFRSGGAPVGIAGVSISGLDDVTGLAHGGLITDTGMALVHQGEVVVPAAEADRDRGVDHAFANTRPIITKVILPGIGQIAEAVSDFQNSGVNMRGR